MDEEGIVFSVPKGVFYNPNMRFCRSFASLAVGATEEELKLCDAFCASGIRGIRYALENPNVEEIAFLDMEEAAIEAAKRNAERNRLKARFLHGNISRLVFELACDFAEIDPFGSPVPYLYDSFRLFNPLKRAYLSVTATDVAVTCGGKVKACMKHYHSRPMNNDFTHETGIRIVIKKIAETAAEFNMGITPLVSLSHRHYQKVILKLRRSADGADRCMRSLGYVNHCPSCGARSSSQFPVPGCPECGKPTDFAGPLWLGELHDRAFLERMIQLNEQRQYSQKKQLGDMLGLMEGEVGMPPYYYNIHALCRILGTGTVPKFDALIGRLREKGYRAVRTHFCRNSIKTDAHTADIMEAIGWRG